MNTYRNFPGLPSPPRFGPAGQRPRIGLALSGGGAKAVAHVGVLDALVRAGVTFDLVAGTSAGALAGLFYCAGHDPDSMAYVLRTELSACRWWRWLPFGKYWRLSRLLRGGGLQRVIARHVPARRFEELPIPFFVTSTDLVRGEAVVHERGELLPAVQASMSLPGFARPVRDGERLLVDGGLLTYLPSEVLKQRGADLVVGVELSGDSLCDSLCPVGGGAFSVLRRSWALQHQALHGAQLAAADVLIRPRLAGLGSADFAHMGAMFERGRQAGELAVERIRALLEDHPPKRRQSYPRRTRRATKKEHQG
jgi:NTE family protein